MTKQPSGCDDLIAAFTIFKRYTDESRITNCDHDILVVCVSPSVVSQEDKQALEELHFNADEGEDHFYSFVFGSC